MTSQLRKMELIEDPGSIEPLFYEKLFLEKQYQIKIDPQRHVLHLPGEPALLITAGERRTAVSEIPPLETEIQNRVDICAAIIRFVAMRFDPNQKSMHAAVCWMHD